MTTRIVTCKKSDWSGEDVSVPVTLTDGYVEFALYGYTFRLVLKTQISDEGDGLGSFTQYAITSPNWTHPVGYVARWSTDREWISSQELGFERGITREDADPVVAAVQLLCNVL